MLEGLEAYLGGRLEPTVQPEEGATYVKMLSKEDGRLSFAQSALEIDRKVRALNDWPGTYIEINQQILKIRKVKVILSNDNLFGMRSVLDKVPTISTSDGWVQLLEVQPAGKKWMSGADYLRGTKDWISNQSYE